MKSGQFVKIFPLENNPLYGSTLKYADDKAVTIPFEKAAADLQFNYKPFSQSPMMS